MGLFSRIFKSSSGDSVLGIDIGSSAIKVVQLRKKGGRAFLETYGALALGPYAGVEVGRATNLQAPRIVEALNDILREAQTTTKQCGIAMPFKSSLMSLIELPAVSPKQMAQMVPIEARKYIPVPISEVTLDYSVIPRDESKNPKEKEENEEEKKTRKSKIVGKQDVLIVAIHNNVIALYQDIIEKAELDASFFEVEIFSTMRAVIDQSVAPVMIVDMGAATTKLYIVERGVVRVSHTINRGSQDITMALSHSMGVSVEQAELYKRSMDLTGSQADKVIGVIESTLDFIFVEANRVILNYQKKYQKNIPKVMMVGGGSALKGLAELARQNFQMDVEAGNPFSKIETPAFLEDILKRTGPEFAVAAGVALRRLQE